MSARRVAVAAVVLLLAAACADAASPITTPPVAPSTSPPTTAVPATTAAPPPTAPPTTTTTTTTVASAGIAGAAGVGDPYLPGLGNGGYDVEHYTVELDVDPVANSIAGTATIVAVATADLASFNLDLFGLDVDTVAIDGAPAGFTRAGAELTISAPMVLAAGEDFVATIAYGGTPQPQALPNFPLSLGWQGGDGATFVISEPNGAQTWYPVNDHPIDKATYTFRITVPSGYTAAANGVLADRVEGGTETTFVWEMSQPMASYLATVVVGRLTEFREEAFGGLPIRNYLPADGSVGPELFARTPEMIEFLEGLLGPYPFDAYGVAVVGDFPAALETQTLSLFGGAVLALPPDVVDRVVIHELAHQWFGNSVTPATWRDIWLNEGFATLFEWLWLEHVGGPNAFSETVGNEHQIATEFATAAPADPGIEGLFGEAVYVRGGLVLAALRAEVGDEAFFEILRAYYERFAYGNASTADFLAVASEVAGTDLDAFLGSWLEDPIVPPLED